MQENSSSAANNGSAAPVQTASPKQKGSTCLDGLWEVVQQAGTLLEEHPDVIAHALHVLSVMWQVRSTLQSVSKEQPQCRSMRSETVMG